jgi:hypothetical protein
MTINYEDSEREAFLRRDSHGPETERYVTSTFRRKCGDNQKPLIIKAKTSEEMPTIKRAKPTTDGLADGNHAPASHEQPVQNVSGSMSERGSSQTHLRDCQELSRGQLRLRYPGEYSCWRNMKYRCRCGYAAMSPEFEEFRNFLAIVGLRPGPNWSIDRIDNELGYLPANVRWADKSTQSNNRKSVRLLKDDNGRADTAENWARMNGLPASTIRKRLSRGWSEHEAIHGSRPRRLERREPRVSQQTASEASELDVWPGKTLSEAKNWEWHYRNRTPYFESDDPFAHHRHARTRTRAKFLLIEANKAMKILGERYAEGEMINAKELPQFEYWERVAARALAMVRSEAIEDEVATRIDPYAARDP